MSGKASSSAGLQVFSIGGRMVDVRQRCLGMSDWERQWRAQFLKDQLLAADEPRDVPALYKSTTNIFRRVYKTPLRFLKKKLVPSLGEEKAQRVSEMFGRSLALLMIAYGIVYYFKYSANDWTKRDCWKYYFPRGRMLPDQPGFPNYKRKTEKELYDNGFCSSPYCVTIKKPPPSKGTPKAGPPVITEEKVIQEPICPADQNV